MTFDQPGIYTLRLTASDTLATTSADVAVRVNAAPVVNAGTNQLVALGTLVVLAGSYTDDGIPGPTVTTLWTQISGPAGAVFADPTAASTTVSLSQSGVYEFQLTANDGLTNGSAQVTITVDQAPLVTAVSPILINWPANQVVLNGTVTDDGLPEGGTLTMLWTQISGPGPVNFSLASSTSALNGTAITVQPSTLATFTAPGLYVLRLAGNDGQSANHADVVVTVNQTPTVNAGTNQIITWPVSQVVLQGTATDDGLPVGSSLAAGWSEISGPGTVAFANASSTNTTATFSTNGVYVLKLSASDGVSSNSSTVTITVEQAPVVALATPAIITWPGNQVVLNGIVTDDGLPVGGVLNAVWTQISGPGSVSFSPSLSTNELAGTALTNELTTTATFSAPGSYLVQLTADDGMSTNQAQVTVIVNQAPTVTATATPLVNLPQTAVLTGSVNDDGLPNGTVTSLWTQSSGPGVVTFADPTSPTTTASFSVSGIYILNLTASDGAASATTNVTVIANSPPNVSVTANPQVFNLGSSSTLTGVVSDDGLPNGTLSFAWSQLSGPGTATFSNPTSTNTTISFSAAGTYTLQLVANDSAATGGANLTLTVLPGQQVNPALQLIVPGAQTTAPNNVLVFDIFNDILVVGSNIGSDQLQLSMTVSNATLTLGATNGLIWVAGADGSSNVVVQGTLDDINAALDELAYVPITNFVGSDTLVVSVTDVAQGGGSISDSNTVAISVVNADQAPAVYAGVTYPLSGSINVLFPGDAASLWAIVYLYNDGLPNGPLTCSWSQLDGPGTAMFANSNALDTAVSFTQAGTYDLQFSASDGAFSSSVIVSVTVITPDAMPSPSVFAGSFQEITLPASAALNGFVYTNGPIANSQILWSQISGPGSVTFADSGSPVTTAGFSAPGLYQLRLEMDQQQWWWWWTWWDTLASDTVYVQVDPATGENQAPVVYAGPARTVLVNTPVQLNGQVSDDGLPAGTLTSVRQFVDGPVFRAICRQQQSGHHSGFHQSGPVRPAVERQRFRPHVGQHRTVHGGGCERGQPATGG